MVDLVVCTCGEDHSTSPQTERPTCPAAGCPTFGTPSWSWRRHYTTAKPLSNPSPSPPPPSLLGTQLSMITTLFLAASTVSTHSSLEWLRELLLLPMDFTSWPSHHRLILAPIICKPYDRIISHTHTDVRGQNLINTKYCSRVPGNAVPDIPPEFP